MIHARIAVRELPNVSLVQLEPQEASVVQEMVLGDRSLMPEYLEEAFGRSDITDIHAKPQNI